MKRAPLVLAIAAAALSACHHTSLHPRVRIQRGTYVLPLAIKDTDYVCLQRDQNDVTMPCRTAGELRQYFFYTVKANP